MIILIDFLIKKNIKITHPERAVLTGSGVSMLLQKYKVILYVTNLCQEYLQKRLYFIDFKHTGIVLLANLSLIAIRSSAFGSQWGIQCLKITSPCHSKNSLHGG